MGVGMGTLMGRAGISGGSGAPARWAGGGGGGERVVGGGGAWAVVWFRLGLSQGLHLANGLGGRGSCNVRTVLRGYKLNRRSLKAPSVKL